MISLAKDFFFIVGFPAYTSNFESKNELKSPTIISFFLGFASNFSNNTNMLLHTFICSFAVLELYQLSKMYSESLIETSRIKMRPFLLVSYFLTKTFFSKVSSYDTARIYFSVRKENLTFKVLFPFLFNFTFRVSFL